MRTQKSSRWSAMLLATVVAIITCMAVANATQTITTPNAVNIAYNLAGGLNSAPITPAAGKPVLVMGTCTTAGDQSVGQVSLLHIPSTSSSAGYITWVGLESPNGLSTGGASITWGPMSTTASHIVYIDLSHSVDIQLAGVSPGDTIVIHNGATVARAGNVTLVW